MIERRIREPSTPFPTKDTTLSSGLNRRVSRRRLLQDAVVTATAPFSRGLTSERVADYEVEPGKPHSVLTVILDNSKHGYKEELLKRVQNELTSTAMQPHASEYNPPESAIQEGIPSFSTFYKVATNGKVSFDVGTIKYYRISPDIGLGPFLDIAKGSKHLLWVRDGIELDAFDIALFIISTREVDRGGLAGADPSSGYAYFYGLESVRGRSIAHEVGHLLGLDHAGRHTNPYSYTEPIEPSNPHWGEYGDIYDIMGKDPGGRWGFNIVNKEKLGVVEKGQIKEVTESGEYFIDSDPTGETIALKIPVPNSPFDYYVSYPAPLQYPGDDPQKLQEFNYYFQQVRAHLSWLGVPLEIGETTNEDLTSNSLIHDEKNNIYVSAPSKELNKARYGDDKSMAIFVSFDTPLQKRRGKY